MDNSLVQALGILDCSILKRRDDHRFQIVQADNIWLTHLIPDAIDQDYFFIDQSSDFLADFLIDAEQFWKLHSDGQVKSGIWTEQQTDHDLHLEAIAACHLDQQYLVICNVKHEFKKQQETLQIARELLVSNTKTVTKHQYMYERLSSVLNQNTAQNFSSLPIRDAIKHVSMGVIITNALHETVEINNAAFKLLELNPEVFDISPFGIISALIKKQFPESERALATQSEWSGELYWHSPPHFHKWLQVSAYPIFDTAQRLINWIFTISDTTRLKYLLQTNEALSLHDSLTGLPNRQYFWQTLNQHAQQKAPFYVMYLDIKDFKKINELHGHLTGDQLLQDFVQRIQDALSANDFFTRIGSDEFAIIHHPNTSQKDARSNTLSEPRLFASRIRTLCKEPFYTQKHDRCILSTCIGISHFPFDADQAEDLMKYADLALFAAKQTSVPSIQFYSTELKAESEQRIYLENALRNALDNQQFDIYLQPIINIETGAIVKAEALLRWQISNAEFIPPDVFIPIAEKSGLIVPIGRWVINRVCEVISELNALNIHFPITLNLSPRQISDRHLDDVIVKSIERNKVDANRLELEITEGVLVDNHHKVSKLLTQLRRKGVLIAIDDFGTGYSSLSYLKHLPIDFLKIDRSFLKELEANADDQAIVQAIIAMAKSLKLEVIAEGLETEYQRQFLIRNNCNIAQGFLYSKALPFNDFVEFVNNSTSIHE